MLANADNQQSVALRSVIKEALGGDRWATADPVFEVDIAIENPIQTNPELLQVIVEELVDNAVEHTETERPTIRIEACRTGDRHYELFVSDNGPGIPESELAPLKNGTETALVHGSGLGLWLVTWGVRHLGGTIDYETADDGGAIARMTLPAGVPPQA